MTCKERIRSMNDLELGKFLRMVARDGEPWEKAFYEKFCRNCPTVYSTDKEVYGRTVFHECDFVDGQCPNGSKVTWWLKQPAENFSFE